MMGRRKGHVNEGRDRKMGTGKRIVIGCRIVAACTAATVLLSVARCMSDSESMVADVSPEGWKEPVEMRYHNTDTLAVKELSLAIRHGAEAGDIDGRYIVETLSPWGKLSCDTLTINIVSDYERKKTGEASSAPAHITFSETGEYRFTVTPMQSYSGIWSVGIEVRAVSKR